MVNYGYDSQRGITQYLNIREIEPYKILQEDRCHILRGSIHRRNMETYMRKTATAPEHTQIRTWIDQKVFMY